MTKIAGLAGAAAAAYLSKSENREKLKGQLGGMVQRLKSSQSNGQSVEKKWGKPSNDADSKMVNEGAMTSVQYYNERQDKEELR
jgi:hypothetical protein